LNLSQRSGEDKFKEIVPLFFYSPDHALRIHEQRIKDICQTRVRYGYRRVHVMLCREGWHINQKRTRRIYRELGLQLRNKMTKRDRIELARFLIG
jgi:transposase InsO family protein